MSNEAGAKIAISGKSGCGNTTVSKLLAERLSLRFINFTFRSLAEERGMALAEILRRAEADDSWDREVDGRQAALAREPGGCVLGSRLAIWMLPEADLKVYLTARQETRVKRILAREGGDPEKVAEFTAKRDAHDRERYIKIYNIDNDDFTFADLVIDTDELDPGGITDLIIRRMTDRGLLPGR
ncbi:MAG: AAA family ATPase [Spirochaetaceae bacterium]|jgi:cytidylate kinase|nr:AAA family ATPase [Spirochaetaceae bacterium]